MKKIVSVILVYLVFFAAVGVPAAASTVSYDITTSAAVEINAAEYSASYDTSTDSTEITIEGGNVSFNWNDYVEYILNVEESGMYSVGVYTSTNSGDVPIFDVMVDGEVRYTQNFVGEGWSNYKTVKNYIYLEKGTRTLRLFNKSYGMYLSKITIAYEGDVLELKEENNSAADYVAGGLGCTKEAGTEIVFSVNAPQDGIYKLDLKASRSTNADIYIYSDIYFLNKVNFPKLLKSATNSVLIKLETGINIVRMKVASGSLYAADLTVSYLTLDDEERLSEVIGSVEKAETADEVYSVIKQNENVFGIAIDEMVSGLEYPEFVFTRLLNRSFTGGMDFINAVYNAVKAETDSPSLLTSVSGTTLKVTAKTDIYKSDGVFAAAIYSENRLVSMNFADYTKGTDVSVSLSGYESGMKLKTFTFDTISEINPSELSGGVCSELFVSESGSDETGDGSKDSPYATIKKAKEKVAELTPSMTGDIVVNIEPGYYELSETEVFNESHGGIKDYKVIYRGTDKENPPVISGGKKITGWQEEEGGIYSAPLSGSQVRDLFVGEYPAQRARSKYVYELESITDETSYTVAKTDENSSIEHPEDLVFVWHFMWAAHYTPVDGMTVGDESVTYEMNSLAMQTLGTETLNIKPPKRFYMENALEFLDEPGEYYHDYHAGKIYYMPYPEEDMETTEAFVSNLDRTIDVSGESKESRASNMVFDNLAVKYGTWNSEGLFHVQADQYYAYGVESKIPAQFVVNNADNISVENCEFSCIGANALEFYDSVSNSHVKGNLIKDIGGCGISIGNFMRPSKTEEEDGLACTEIEVSNNVIRRTSLVYRGTTGIAVYFEKDIDVINNDIAELPYSGITAGWGWGKETAKFGDLTISNNRIDNIMQLLTDGGHIYTLGNMPGSVIAGNYMTNSADYRGGIYTDSGSQNIELLYNVCDNNVHWWNVGLYYTKDMYAFGNVTPRAFVNDSGENIVVEGHVEVADGDFESAAGDIIAAAGLIDEYKHLTENTSLPSWRKSTFIVPVDTYQDTLETWIEAEDFLPGYGTGYMSINFNEPYNNVYRPEGLNLYRNNITNKGFYIHRVSKGDWMAYSITVPEDGTYFFDLKAANGYDESTNNTIVDISVDGELILDDVKFPNTVTWDYYLPVRLGKLELTEGTHTLKVEYAGSGFHIDALRVVKASETRIPMTEYTSAYCSKKESDSLFIEGVNTTWHIGDWAEYTVSIENPGTYRFGMEFGSNVGDGLKNLVKVNGTTVFENLKVSTGTFTDKHDVAFGDITFEEAGVYTLYVENTGGSGGHYVGDIYLEYLDEQIN